MIQVRGGTPGALHALDPFEPGEGLDPPMRGLELWRCVPDSSAIVLGSGQREEMVDRAACERAGLGVAKRRSGGGAVLIIPDDIVWIDIVAARGWFPDDVRASMIIVGECWREALIDQWASDAADTDVDPGELTVHRGGMVASSWSELVCFAGLGPGEVMRSGKKLVGLSQRRTRNGVRIQGLLHRRSDLQSMRALFAVGSPDGELAEPACWPDLDAVSFTQRLARRMTERVSSTTHANGG